MDRAAVESGAVPHFYDYLKCGEHVKYQICIPSFNRPVRLCTTTLRLLSRHGIAMDRVHIFVAPTPAPAQDRPEWSRYIRELRERGYSDEHAEPGEGRCVGADAGHFLLDSGWKLPHATRELYSSW